MGFITSIILFSNQVYQEPLFDKVRFKHTMAKCHFSKMSTMSKFFENGRPIKTKQ